MGAAPRGAPAPPPMRTMTGPTPATQKALAKSGLRVDEIGAWECNEAFASVPLAWLAEIGADEKALNPNGGAIALGHPLGGSGARIMTTLVHHMRDHGIRYGLQTMCEGGGQGHATILELLQHPHDDGPVPRSRGAGSSCCPGVNAPVAVRRCRPPGAGHH